MDPQAFCPVPQQIWTKDEVMLWQVMSCHGQLDNRHPESHDATETYWNNLMSLDYTGGFFNVFLPEGSFIVLRPPQVFAQLLTIGLSMDGGKVQHCGEAPGMKVLGL
eukprot:1011384-Amphidinium_carterae.1